MITRKDEEYMRRACELALRGRGFTSPNPLVGAVIVKDGRVIGEGWHKKYGGLHAEREALAACVENPQGSTMYVTLEPCCHHGKQPPCTEAVIAAGISRVVVGIADPNPLVAGKGLEILSAHGIEVELGVIEDELKHQNRVFLKYITDRMPWVTVKCAMTLDGRTAVRTGDSKWVSSETSREFVHRLRSWNMGIMVGMGTVRADDPMLNCRLDGGRNPVRVIVDTDAALPLSSQIVRTARDYRTVVAHVGSGAGLDSRISALHAAGVETLQCREIPVAVSGAPGRPHKVDVRDLMKKLGEMGIDSVLVEGGAELNWSVIEASLADEFYFFIAPKIVGGSSARGGVGGEGFARMADAMRLRFEKVEPSGEDILIHAFPDRG